MIAVDASSLLAVLLNEADRSAHYQAMAESGGFVVSAVNAWEAAVKAEQLAEGEGIDTVKTLLAAFDGEVAPVSATDWEAAVSVWRRFGKTRHPAQLNLGDCFAYALAESRGLPLLYKGKDFPQTDIASVL